MNRIKSRMDINPIVVKELRSRMRGGRTFLTMSIVLLLTGGALLGMIYLLTSMSGSGNVMLSYQVGSILFTLLVNLELLIICVVTPAVTAGSISGEIEKLTFDLLLATPLSPARILIGKLVSAMSYIVMLLIAAIPMASIVFVFGGVTLSSMAKALIMLCVVAVMAGCLGLFFSAWFRKSGRATIVSLVVMIALLLVPVFVSFVLLVTDHNEIPRWLVALSPISAVSSSIISGGVQDTSYNPLSLLFLGGVMDQTLVPVSQTTIPRPVYHYSLVIFSAFTILFYLGALSMVNPLQRFHLTRKQLLSGLLSIILLVGIAVTGFLLTADHYEWYVSSDKNADEIQIDNIMIDDIPIPEESEKVIVPEEISVTPTEISSIATPTAPLVNAPSMSPEPALE